jgi:single-stranded-DNA-specific exonuclease
MHHVRNPNLLPDMKEAIARLMDAADNKESVFVWGDYDVDGITSTAVVVYGLKMLGIDVHYYVPHRIKDGYDIKPKAVDMALANNCSILMSVDCGIKALDVGEYAKQKGVDLIITDHHMARLDGLIPEAVAVINPNRIDSDYPFKGLAGCGIAFKLMAQLAHKRGIPIMEVCRELLELVAIGTVADVAPMLDENRFLVHSGLQYLAATTKPGLIALLEDAKIKGEIDSTMIGFRLGPRMNAIGRIGDSGDCLQLVLEQNASHARRLAEMAGRMNKSRQAMQEQQLREAASIVDERCADRHVLVVSSNNWHLGVVGLVASQLTHGYARPAMVGVDMQDGTTKGSCRSYRNFHLLDAMESPEVKKRFLKYGGHAFAAGFTAKTEDMPGLLEAINEYAADKMPDEKRRLVDIDADVEFSDINERLLVEMRRMEPFGNGNPTPVFACHDIRVSRVDKMGEKHLKLSFNTKDPDSKNFIEARWWGHGHMAEHLPEGAPVNVAFKLENSDWGGRSRLQMNVEDVKLRE